MNILNNVLWDSGTAVYLYEAKGITDRLLGQDIVGIVPEHVIPVYCEIWGGMENGRVRK